MIEPQLLKQSERFGRKIFSAEGQLLIAVWTMATPDSYRYFLYINKKNSKKYIE